jgi:pyridoxamine 5'-phosphate oxidase
MPMKIADLRQDYQKASLDESDVSPNPFVQFDKWFSEAIKSEILEPNAMTLATSTPDGMPSARVVLLKGVEHHHEDIEAGGFIFYTNYNSHKGQEITMNPHIALCFNWLDLQRQVRIEGVAHMLNGEISTEYFNSRPKSSRIGAIASPQSSVVPNREYLENRYAEWLKKYNDTEEVPRPKHWGGYIVKPSRIEFWQGRSSRLHDRMCYFLQSDNTWMLERLAP